MTLFVCLLLALLIGKFVAENEVCDVCVNVRMQDRCNASELAAGVDLSVWRSGPKKCSDREECCNRDSDDVNAFASKAAVNCQKNCRLTCPNQGSNQNLYTATWSRVCLNSCDILKMVLFNGILGSDCPLEEPCLKSNFNLQFSFEDTPEIVTCKTHSSSCTECLLTKTLPDYESRVASCQSTCSHMKTASFGKGNLSTKAVCAMHLYGQYISFIQEACSEEKPAECIPDGFDLRGGYCRSEGCSAEKEKCYKDAAPLAKNAAQIVSTRWRASCEENCDNATEEAFEECMARGRTRTEEVESEVLIKMCEFLDRS